MRCILHKISSWPSHRNLRFNRSLIELTHRSRRLQFDQRALIQKLLYTILVALIALIITACDPMAPQPVVIVVTDTPTYTPTPFVTNTPTSTRTPIPTETPDFTPTPTPFPCEEDGTLDELSLSGDSAQESIRYSVYAPPCYGASRQRFPVLYLLHDTDQTSAQWQDIGIIEALNTGIRLGALPPMLVVMPNGGDLSDRNSFPPDTSYETLLWNATSAPSTRLIRALLVGLDAAAFGHTAWRCAIRMSSASSAVTALNSQMTSKPFLRRSIPWNWRGIPPCCQKRVCECILITALPISPLPIRSCSLTG
jgi:hypothetical protein